MNIVVGSGPAAVACASALLDRGMPVLMVDAALSLGAEATGHVQALAASPKTAWPADSVRFLTAGRHATRGGVPMKYVFASDYPYRVPSAAPEIAQEHARVLRSYGVGGLSQAWGATILPYADDDITDWPIRRADLAPHYEAVMRFVPLAAEDDDLSESFPLFTSAPQVLVASRQARHVLDAISRNRDMLRQRGITGGRARLAVNAGASARSCRACGFCLNGCPYGSIYSAEHTLDQLKGRTGFTHRPGLIVQRVRETADRAVVTATRLDSGTSETIEGDRVFLGCGFLNTTVMVLDALPPRAGPIDLPSSQAFLVPFWLDTPMRGVESEDLHTLSQVYLHLVAPEIAAHRVQLQVYTYNDLLPLVLDMPVLKWLWAAAPSIKARVLERLVVVQGFLHSRDSDPLQLTRSKDGRLTLSGNVSQRTKATVRKVVMRLMRERQWLGGAALRPLLTLSRHGQSYHSAGGFPMSATPGPGQSDLLGRPTGLHRVHIVDAAAFPSVPATTITLTAMANAHRIGSLAGN